MTIDNASLYGDAPEPVIIDGASIDVADAAARLEQTLFEVKKVIVGQDHMVERLLVSLLARGHILLEGLPGLAKTLAVSTLATAVGGSFVRLQFTPDLLPSDLVGTRIWRASDERFDIEWGPVFANLVLTDEINRAPAKVQSALLEVMAERQVSIGGETRALPSPFLVLATQNPIESEGVYTLPEAQRDRFLMKVTVGYPSPAEELEIVRRSAAGASSVHQAITLAELEQLQIAADRVYVDAAVANYAVDLVMATREPALRGLPELEPFIEFGVSPRATLGLVAAGRALALLRGRSYVVPQDVFDVARDVLRHRVMLSYEALAKDLSADDIINRVLSVIPAASVSPLPHGATGTFAAQPAPPEPSATPGPTAAVVVPPPPPQRSVPPATEGSTSAAPAVPVAAAHPIDGPSRPVPPAPRATTTNAATDPTTELPASADDSDRA
jgi:MoxR-like ATPase